MSSHIGLCLLQSGSARAVFDVSLATDVSNRLESYRRLSMPAKPLSLDFISEDELLDRLQDPKSGDTTLATFGAWRCAVLGVESANAWRCEAVMLCADTLRRIVDENPAHQSDLDALETFLADEWGVREKPTNGLDIQDRAHGAAVDYRTLSLSLRMNRKTVAERMELL